MLIKSDIDIQSLQLNNTTEWTELPVLPWGVTVRIQARTAVDLKVSTSKDGPYWTLKSGTALQFENFRGVPRLWVDHAVAGPGNGPTIEILCEK